MKQRTITIPPEHLFPADEWRIIEATLDAGFAARAETALALSNGYLGVRGSPDEGRPAFAPGTFINGFHETWPIVHAEEAYGLARVGQTIVNVPDVTVIELYVDDEPLFLPTARTPEYLRVLDMRNGVLKRDLVWATPSGKHVGVRSTRLVSFEHRHVVAISYEVTIDRQRARDHPVAGGQPGEPGASDEVDGETRSTRDSAPNSGGQCSRHVSRRHEGERLVLGYETVQSGMTLAVGRRPRDRVPEPAHGLGRRPIPTTSELVIVRRCRARCADPTRRSTRPTRPLAAPPSRSWHSGAGAPSTAVTGAGFDTLVAEQRSCLDRFWDRADVTLEDTVRHPVRMQQAVRWNLFHLAQATWRAEGAGIPAKGLTGNAYDGHYFWDTETWVLPFLAYTQPRIARNLLRFRHSMLPSARAGRASSICTARSSRGGPSAARRHRPTSRRAPRSSTSTPTSPTPSAATSTSAATSASSPTPGPRSSSRRPGCGPTSASSATTADSTSTASPGPTSTRRVVDDNAYTNLMARLNLHYAAATMRRLPPSTRRPTPGSSTELRLEPSELDAWERAADRMFVPHDPGSGITPQDATFLSHERWDLDDTPPEKFPLLLHYHPLAIYRRQVLKQADVVMAMFLLGNEFTLEQKRRNFDYYDPLTTGDSSLSASIQSIVASEIGNEEAACRYFDFALMMDLADVAGNVSAGVHVASAAGSWMGLVFGFGGVRDFDGQLTIDPHLPRRFASLGFSLRFHDRQVRVQLTHERERYSLTEGEPLDVVVRGQQYMLTDRRRPRARPPRQGLM